MLPAWRVAAFLVCLGSVLAPRLASAAPSGVGLRTAIAATPEGTTRWSDVSLPSGERVAWLVPVRPGAAVDWAPGPWLEALERATQPRILPAEGATRCTVSSEVETPAVWTAVRVKQGPATFTVRATADEARQWASAQGFDLSSTDDARLGALYASGWQTVAVDLGAHSMARMSATLRVRDDGGPMLPFALVGGATEAVHTVFVVGAGAAEIVGANGASITRDIDPSQVLWGTNRSNYGAFRREVVEGGAWLRESASHAPLFDDQALTSSEPEVRPVAIEYFDSAVCAARVRAAGANPRPSPAALTCDGLDDFALALAGTAPASALVTRLVGVQSSDALIATAGESRPVAVRAGNHDECSTDPPRPPKNGGTRPPASSGGGATAPSTTEDEAVWSSSSDGCGGGGSTVVVADDYEDPDTDSWYSGDSGDCSGDTSDGWDSGDDSCSGDTTSGDGWDSSDSTCSTTRSKGRGPSPLSRLVLFVAALILPLRRLLRPSAGDKS